MSVGWGGDRRSNRHIDATLAAIDAVLGNCGHDMGDDPHDADELGSEQVCPDCCKHPGCKSSETTRPVSDLDGGASPPTTGSAASAGPVCGQTAAAPAIDSRSTNQGEKP